MCVIFLPTLYAIVVCGAMSSEAFRPTPDADARSRARPSFARPPARGLGFVAARRARPRPDTRARAGRAGGRAAARRARRSRALSAATRSAEPDPESMPELAFRILNEYTGAPRGASPPAKRDPPGRGVAPRGALYRNSVLEVAADSLNAGDDAESLDYGWEIAGPLRDRSRQRTRCRVAVGRRRRARTTTPRSSSRASAARRRWPSARAGKYRIAVAELARGGGISARDEPVRVVQVRAARAARAGRTRTASRSSTPPRSSSRSECAEGKATYGRKFDCISTFTRLHADLAGVPYCDHAHDGYGFLNQHVGLALWFARAPERQQPRRAAVLGLHDRRARGAEREPGTRRPERGGTRALVGRRGSGRSCPRPHRRLGPLGVHQRRAAGVEREHVDQLVRHAARAVEQQPRAVRHALEHDVRLRADGPARLPHALRAAPALQVLRLRLQDHVRAARHDAHRDRRRLQRELAHEALRAGARHGRRAERGPSSALRSRRTCSARASSRARRTARSTRP